MYKKYIIVNGHYKRPYGDIGELFYAREKSYMRFYPGRDVMDIPMEFHRLYSDGVLEYGSDMFDFWIEDRMFPPYRQGAEHLLARIGLTEYDKYAIFIAYEGRSVRDKYYIVEVD